MRRIFHLDLLFLVLSATGALVLSASNTFAIMKSTGDIVAFASVLTLETGLAGLILSLEPEKSDHWVWKFWGKVKLAAPAFLIVIMLMVTNLLNNIGALNIAISDQFQNIVQLVVLGGFIPLLALTTLHAAKDRWQYYAPDKKEPKVEKLKKPQRQKLLIKMLRNGETIDIDEQAKQWGISPATLSKDYNKIAEQLRQEF